MYFVQVLMPATVVASVRERLVEPMYCTQTCCGLCVKSYVMCALLGMCCTSRGFGSAVVFEGAAYIIGGVNDFENFGDVWMFSATTQMWKQVSRGCAHHW